MCFYRIFADIKTYIMLVISPTQFRTSQKKYLDLAEKERVVIKRGEKIIELVVSDRVSNSPSPRNDPWFNNPKNIESVMKGIEEVKAGKTIEIKDPNDIWASIL
jgi:hypothetical protein